MGENLDTKNGLALKLCTRFYVPTDGGKKGHFFLPCMALDGYVNEYVKAW